jgi:prevent-host-death family protein
VLADQNIKGNVAELAIAAEAARLGLTVLMPMTEHERYDLVLGIAGKLLRVQSIGVYRGELRRCYFLPIVDFAGKKMVHLRVGPARNNQRASLHWATDYEFPGAVAQLEERRHGMAEVRGSSPLSSTAEFSASNEVVGAHEFRNRFGFYLEQAAAGSEISISRHGRPYARLVPAVLNPVATTADA